MASLFSKLHGEKHLSAELADNQLINARLKGK
jgi:hypothetical protein